MNAYQTSNVSKWWRTYIVTFQGIDNVHYRKCLVCGQIWPHSTLHIMYILTKLI